MMTREQFLLLKLAEEASEVAHIALKTIQFGMHDCKPGQNLTNAERIYAELNDLNAIVHMLRYETDFAYLQSAEAIDRKIERVNEFCGYSVRLERVEPFNPASQPNPRP